MNASLKLLVELQQLDHSIGEFETEIRALPQKVSRIESQLSEQTRRVESDRKALAENQQTRRKRENEIALLREKTSRYRDQVFEVKTNEQYRALQHEIQYLEGQISGIEDQILTAMIEAESLEKRMQESQQQLEMERSRAQEEIAAAQKNQQEDETKLNAARRQREEIRNQLAPDIYGQYERIARFRKGLAVVPVRNGSCGACHVRLRPQAYNEVKTNQQVLSCESCGRILYFVPEAPPE